MLRNIGLKPITPYDLDFHAVRPNTFVNLLEKHCTNLLLSAGPIYEQVQMACLAIYTLYLIYGFISVSVSLTLTVGVEILFKTHKSRVSDIFLAFLLFQVFVCHF